MKILVVDDEITWIAPFARFMEKKHLIYIATNGLDALKIFRSVKLDLVVTDVVMPRMCGIDFVREIRKSDEKVPIIVITGQEESWIDKESAKLAVTAVIRKPIKVEPFLDLLVKIEDIVEPRVVT